MASFDELSKKILSVKQTTVQKTQNLTETIKLKNSISSIQKQLNEYYAQIGETFFHDNESGPEEKYNDLFIAVNNCIDQINDLNSKIKAIENMKLCPKCGTKLEEGNKFCTNCGHLINQ